MEKTITKLDKTTRNVELVSVEEFLEFVGTGTKRREEALSTLIIGGLYQNVKVAYFIECLRD